MITQQRIERKEIITSDVVIGAALYLFLFIMGCYLAWTIFFA